jgi:antitoxin component of RelBE/YafQ-DinJ toxin-antitoxin module
MKTLINIKADKDIKIKAQKTAKKIGLSLSSIMNAYLRHFVKTKEVYFSAEPKHIMSSTLEKTLREVENDLKTGKNLSPAFSSALEMDKYLNSK